MFLVLVEGELELVVILRLEYYVLSYRRIRRKDVRTGEKQVRMLRHVDTYVHTKQDTSVLCCVLKGIFQT